MLKIVSESVQHHEAIRHVTIQAFSASELGHNGEADLIDKLRDHCEQVVSLVAIENDTVVGHILFSRVTLRNRDRTVLGMGLAPLSVVPSHQRKGIGSLLVHEGLRRLPESRAAFTVVAGHPKFYLRFGFQPAADFGVEHGFVGMPQELLFLRIEKIEAMSRAHGGSVDYHPAFGPQHVDGCF